MTNRNCSVLIVEDEEKLADLYAKTLAETYEVTTAYSGQEALERVDESVDAVLLDRKMPGLSGRDVLERIREEGYDCRVAMLTAVRPDWDVIEMGFDDYLLKPVDDGELHRAVERLRALGAVDEEVREYVRKSVTRAALEGEKDPADLETSEAFADLAGDLAKAGIEIGDVTADLSPEETDLILETITRNLESEGETGGFGE